MATGTMHFFGYHAVMPGSYSVLANLLMGGVPSCFRELRFMTELLAKCYLADARDPSSWFFGDKLEALQSETGSRGKRRPEIDFISEFDEKCGLSARR